MKQHQEEENLITFSITHHLLPVCFVFRSTSVYVLRLKRPTLYNNGSATIYTRFNTFQIAFICGFCIEANTHIPINVMVFGGFFSS